MNSKINFKKVVSRIVDVLSKNKQKVIIVGLAFLLGFSLSFNLMYSNRNNALKNQYKTTQSKLEKTNEKIEEIDVNLTDKEIDSKYDNKILVEATEKEVNKEAYYIRNEIMWHNKEITLEQASYKALWYYSIAKKHGIHPYLAIAVGIVESDTRHNVGKEIIENGGSGAVGEMQLMPQTARIYDVNPYVFEENIQGGIKYLADLIDAYDETKYAVAHYNGGSNPYHKVVHWGETRDYTKKVMKIYNSLKEKYS
ncbi:MAG: lytic transglycosylase domain-containing protein [Bacteroidales bacterium]